MAELFTETDRWTVLNALSLARAEYVKYAGNMTLEPRLRQQFEHQVKEAGRLYDWIEQAAEIELHEAEVKEPMPLVPARKWRGKVHGDWKTLCEAVYSAYPDSTVSMGLNEMIVAQAALNVQHVFDCVRAEGAGYYEVCDQPKHSAELYMDATREGLINEYIEARIQEGDLTEAQEEMTPERLKTDLRWSAKRLSNDQLVAACNSYHIAAGG